MLIRCQAAEKRGARGENAGQRARGEAKGEAGREGEGRKKAITQSKKPWLVDWRGLVSQVSMHEVGDERTTDERACGESEAVREKGSSLGSSTVDLSSPELHRGPQPR